MGMKIDESLEDIVILLSRLSYVGFGISNQLLILYIGLNDFYVDHLQLPVHDSLWNNNAAYGVFDFVCQHQFKSYPTVYEILKQKEHHAL